MELQGTTLVMKYVGAMVGDTCGDVMCTEEVGRRVGGLFEAVKAVGVKDGGIIE